VLRVRVRGGQSPEFGPAPGPTRTCLQSLQLYCACIIAQTTRRNLEGLLLGVAKKGAKN